MSRSMLVKRLMFLSLAGGMIFQYACIHGIQQNIEVLFATPANALAVPTAYLIELFGPNILRFFN